MSANGGAADATGRKADIASCKPYEIGCGKRGQLYVQARGRGGCPPHRDPLTRFCLTTLFWHSEPPDRPQQLTTAQQSPCYPRIMDNRDIWRAANGLIEKHGPDAVFHASQRADELLDRGDMDGRRVWQRIHEAVQELLRERPGDRETVQ